MGITLCCPPPQVVLSVAAASALGILCHVPKSRQLRSRATELGGGRRPPVAGRPGLFTFIDPWSETADVGAPLAPAPSEVLAQRAAPQRQLRLRSTRAAFSSRTALVLLQVSVPNISVTSRPPAVTTSPIRHCAGGLRLPESMVWNSVSQQMLPACRC